MNMNKLMALAAVAASATLPMAVNADTVTTNGVTWTYVSNSDGTRTVTLGNTNTTAISTDAEWNASEIPGKFFIDGETYTVTRIGGSGFYGCKGLKGILRIPYSITHIDCDACFRGCSELTGVASWGGATGFKGNFLTSCKKIKGLLPSFSQFTALNTSGYNSYAMFNECSGLTGICINGNIKLNVGYMFRSATSMKVVLVGPNVSVAANLTQNTMFTGVSNSKIIVPTVGWNGLKQGGTNIEVTYYGPTNEISSLTIDETHRVVSMTPTTGASFEKSLGFASLFKEHLDLDTRINVTNTIDLTGVTITDAMVSGVTFDRLMFSAKTQTQLTNVLNAFPPTTPISIDPTGLTENMVIPNDYPNVHVKTVSGVTIRRTASGFMLIVK